MKLKEKLPDLPSTGRCYLDEAIDALGPDAKVAILALLERHGFDPVVDKVRDRLAAYAEWLKERGRLMSLCVEMDRPDIEDRAVFWMTYISAWESARTER